MEAEAFGSELMSSDDEPPTVVGRRVTSLDAARRLKTLPGQPLVLAGMIGPFSLAGRLYGVSESLELTMDNPPLLVKDGYSGEQRCQICHEQQHLQWSLTGHATAFSSLQRKGATDKQDCVACHVTGYGQPGGYQPGRPDKRLHNVQCEACHGPGYQSCSAFTGKKEPSKNRRF